MYGKRKNNYKFNNKTAFKNIFICALVFCILSISLVACCFNEKIVYADYTDIVNDPNSIINFNQHVVDTYTHGTFTSNQAINFASNITIGHHIYIKYNVTDIGQDANGLYFGNTAGNYSQLVGLIQGNTPTLIDTIIVANYSYLNTYMNSSATWTIMAIDLDSMFGSDNLPTLQQCQQLFVADYYNYSSGSPISLSGLNSFIEGVNYAYEQLNFDVVNSSAYTTAYIDPTINNNNAFIERYVDMGTNGQYLYLKARGYLSIPLSQTLSQGSILNFGYTDPGQGGSGNYLYIGILYNNNFIPVMNISTNLTDDTTTNLTMTIPYSTNTIVFVESSTEDYFTFVDSAYWLGDLQVNYAQLDVQVLINSIVSDELRKQKEYYDGYYSYGEGYTKIYNQGLQDGSATGQAFTDSMSFTGSVFHAIGDILAMQVIPNIPLGLFVALPLLVGLLFFIVKIAKGSGG